MQTTRIDKRFFRRSLSLVALGALSVALMEAAESAGWVSGVTEDAVELVIWSAVVLPILLVLGRQTDSRGLRYALLAVFVLLLLTRVLDVTNEIATLRSVPVIGDASPLHRPVKNISSFALGCTILLVVCWLLADMAQSREYLEDKVGERTADLRASNDRLQGEITRRRRAEIELQKSHAELETRVAARTAELTTANRELGAEIAQRGQAEQSLRESEERFRILVENVPAQIVSFARDGVVRYLNHFVNEEERQAIVGRKAQDFLCAASAAEFEKTFNHVFRTRQDGELELITKQGRTYLCRLVAHQENGHVDSILAVASDITQRKQAQNQLRLTRASVENAADAMFTIDPAGRFIDVNETACRRLEYSREELIGMSVWDINPQHPPELWPRGWDHVKRESHVILETTHRTSSGQVFPVEVVAGFVAFDGREYACAFVRDITARKAAEEALRNSERRFHSLAEAAPVGIIQTDARGRCVYVNQRWCDMAGISTDSASGRGWASTIDRVDWQKFLDVMRRRDGEHPFDAVVRLCHADGSVRWALGQAKAVQDNGTIVGFIGGCVDVTESKIAEYELQQLHRELEHVNRVASMGETRSAIAHELNQPLGSIANFAEGAAALLRKGGICRDELAKVLDEIAIEAVRAGEVTRSLRRFVAKTSPRRTVLDINELVRGTSGLLETNAADHHVRLQFECGAHLPQIEADAIQIQQVIVNLVQNANEATAEAGVAAGEVVVSTSRTNGFVCVRVIDQGTGIAAEELERIWEPYYTTKPDGLGLGLCIAQRIVRANRGELSAAVNEQRGMTFEIRLPVRSVEGGRT